MSRYIVKIKNEETRQRLSNIFEDVGCGEYFKTKVVIETEQESAFERIQAVEGVLWVYEDDYFTPEKAVHTFEHPFNWFLNRISKETDALITRSLGEHADIYVMDTGMRLDHEDYVDRAETLYTFDGNDYSKEGNAPDHGTQVGSCAAGTYCGVAKQAMLYNLRFDMSYGCAVKAADKLMSHHLQKERDRVSILNMSFGGAHPMLREEIREMTRNGIVCIAAAGNEGMNRAMYPARERDALSVGSINDRDQISSFSNYGSQIDLFAPGSSGTMAAIDDAQFYVRASGTSFSAPIVAGVIATITDYGSVQSARDVRALFRHVKKHCFEGKIDKARGQGRSPNKIINALSPKF